MSLHNAEIFCLTSVFIYLEILIVYSSTYYVPGTVLGGHFPPRIYSWREDKHVDKYDKYSGCYVVGL